MDVKKRITEIESLVKENNSASVKKPSASTPSKSKAASGKRSVDKRRAARDEDTEAD